MKQCFLDCRFKFFLGYMQRLSPVRPASYFTFGRLAHLGLEKYRIGNILAVREAMDAELANPENQMKGAAELDEFNAMCEQVVASFDGYYLRYPDEIDRYEYLGIERKFAVPIGDDFEFQGKIDAVARDSKNGATYLWEFKTAAQTGSRYWERLVIDHQLLGYLVGLDEGLGFPVHDVIYDVVKKPQIRRKKDQDVESFRALLKSAYIKGTQYYERNRLHYEREQIVHYRAQLEQFGMSLKWHIENGVYPQNTKNCMWRGNCEFLPYCLNDCKWEPHISALYSTRPPEALNPELVEETCDE